MNRLRLTLEFIIISFLPTFGQEHLEPVSGFYYTFDHQFEYYSKIRNILFKGLTDTPILRFVVVPSFTQEHVLDIEGNDGKYYLVFQKVDKPIWGNNHPEAIELKTYRKEIAKESVDLVQKLFLSALEQTRYPERGTHGNDGVNFFFSTWGDFQLLSGTVWSPREGTKLRRLSDIGYDLISMTQADGKEVTLKPHVKEKIEKLMGEF